MVRPGPGADAAGAAGLRIRRRVARRGVGAPAVHVVAVDDPPIAYAADQQLEHYAFAATGLADFLAHLRAEKVAYYCRVLPATETRQINFHDCDGNHLHVDFPASETADLSTYDGT